ncbi:MAG: FAD binding domain-containing protein [Spirochaetales bacterium]|nr:FAD binding domain-containing protein [Spirochaetales bacterium]
MSDNILHIYTPESLNSLITLYHKFPQALLYAGGTEIMRNLGTRELSGEIISLEGVPELDHISRTESYLEIGSCVSLNRLLGIGRHVLTPALNQAISSIGTTVTRNFATLGGNLSMRERWMYLIPVMLLLDVRVEIRRQGNTSWLSMVKYLEKAPHLACDELITRFRIPLETWNIQEYRRFSSVDFGKSNNLTFCGIANVQKGYIQRFRLALGAHGSLIIRNREVENTLEGKKLPLNSRDIQPMKELLDQTLANVKPPLTSIQKKLASRSVLWFITRKLDEGIEEI